MRKQERLVFVDNSIDGIVPREEPWFVRRHDHNIEQIPPGRTFGAVRIDGVVHHLGRVRPVRVRNKCQLLAGPPLVKQRGCDVFVEIYKTIGVGNDLGLEQASHVGLAECLVDHVVQLEIVANTIEQLGIKNATSWVNRLARDSSNRVFMNSKRELDSSTMSSR